MAAGPPVVAGIDGSEESRVAARFAAEDARGRELPLVLLHALTWPYARGGASSADGYAALTQMLADVAAGLGDVLPTDNVQIRVERGDAVAALHAVPAAAELLVVGAHGAGRLSELVLGTPMTPHTDGLDRDRWTVGADAVRSLDCARPTGFPRDPLDAGGFPPAGCYRPLSRRAATAKKRSPRQTLRGRPQGRGAAPNACGMLINSSGWLLRTMRRRPTCRTFPAACWCGWSCVPGRPRPLHLALHTWPSTPGPLHLLFAALGATTSRMEDAQAESAPVTILLTVSYFVAVLYVPQNPDGLGSVVLSFFPPAAPLVMRDGLGSGADGAREGRRTRVERRGSRGSRDEAANGRWRVPSCPPT